MLLHQDVATEVVPRAATLTAGSWEDLLVIVDNGRARAEEYTKVASLASQLSRRYPHGLGILTIIPPDAVPLSDDVRRALNQVLREAEPYTRCYCWLVEGTGFQGAMVRAVCTSLSIFGRHPYPTKVATALPGALGWMLGHLPGGHERAPRVVEAIARIDLLRSTARLS